MTAIRSFTLAALCVLVSAAESRCDDSPAIMIQRDITFAEVDGQQLKLDLYVPR